jgi:hypothetical protein
MMTTGILNQDVAAPAVALSLLLLTITFPAM